MVYTLYNIEELEPTVFRRLYNYILGAGEVHDLRYKKTDWTFEFEEKLKTLLDLITKFDTKKELKLVDGREKVVYSHGEITESYKRKLSEEKIQSKKLFDLTKLDSFLKESPQNIIDFANELGIKDDNESRPTPKNKTQSIMQGITTSNKNKMSRSGEKVAFNPFVKQQTFQAKDTNGVEMTLTYTQQQNGKFRQDVSIWVPQSNGTHSIKDSSKIVTESEAEKFINSINQKVKDGEMTVSHKVNRDNEGKIVNENNKNMKTKKITTTQLRQFILKEAAKSAKKNIKEADDDTAPKADSLAKLFEKLQAAEVKLSGAAKSFVTKIKKETDVKKKAEIQKAHIENYKKLKADVLAIQKQIKKLGTVEDIDIFA